MEQLPGQGSSVGKTRVRINLGAESHEENGGVCQQNQNIKYREIRRV